MRRRTFVTLTLLSAASMALFAAACQIGSDCDFGRCPGTPFGANGNDGGAEGSTDAASDVVQPPPGCDPKAEPKDSPKCVDDGYGVFVSKGGGPTAAGTKAAPLSSIAAAVALAANKGLPRVYVCGPDAFDETVTINAQVSIYGGFSCADWAPSADRPKLAPAKLGSLPLTLAGAPKDNIVLSDFDVTAPDGDPQANRSSIAIFVNQLAGAGATFRRLNVAAGLGRPGDDGAPGTTMTFAAVPGPGKNGVTASDLTGAAAQVCTCSDGKSTTGGKGSATNGASGDNGAPTINPPAPPTATGAGGTTAACIADGTGIGKNGSAATDAVAAKAATNLGTLDATGWKPSDGEPGVAGAHGQGGGGGGAYTIAGGEGGGGGGGCGGCGGTGGGAGKGGGASIAVLVLDSPSLSVSALTLTTKDAGKGGDGAKGGDGDTAGTKGNGFSGACPGGNGGKGANGGAGGGAAGGVSGGVIYKGPKPAGDFAWTGPSTKAARGESPGNPGIEGESAKELEIK